MSTGEAGAVCFGVVIGWITYRTLRRSGDACEAVGHRERDRRRGWGGRDDPL